MKPTDEQISIEAGRRFVSIKSQIIWIKGAKWCREQQDNWMDVTTSPKAEGYYLTWDGFDVDKTLWKNNKWYSKEGKTEENGVFTRADMTQFITHYCSLPQPPKTDKP
jgi:hypothetical protein